MWLVLSGILHLICLYCLILLWQKQSITNTVVNDNVHVKQEMEELLALYIEEMKDQNDALKTLIRPSDVDFVETPKKSYEEQVLHLAKKGHTALEIAQLLQKGEGEVAFLLKVAQT
ncbi:hypothetical protein A374_12435 [Fictibacillus macauensis ZFHKF-1]|uniref:Uncharacterized protein n=1 Tax=Fictibacillus macauensis ZFHKF-1 TaxID=1196324 RepID=I8UDW7_9BACL|nr:hypothetical protein [Fictibacillus macauensis]EIT85105.1 hypothetical protein A374_12435 [Fictibacillus macauensis ZFHKF-1]